MLVGSVKQPVEVLGWTLIAQAACRCLQGGVVALVVQQSHEGRGATKHHCPSCGRSMRVAAVATDENGHLEWQLELGEPRPSVLD